MLSYTISLYCMQEPEILTGEDTPSFFNALDDTPSLKSKIGAYMGIAGIAGYSGFLLYAYKKDPAFKHRVDRISNELKHHILRTLAVPAHLKVKKIQETGPSRGDITKGIFAVITLAVLYKLGEKLHIWQGIRKLDFTKTGDILHGMIDSIAHHKPTVFSSIAAGLCGLVGWKGFKVARQCKIDLVDQFLLSFTEGQREALLQFPFTRTRLEKISEFPLDLESDSDLHKILDPKQKELLTSIIQEYHKNNPHMSLMAHFDANFE